MVGFLFQRCGKTLLNRGTFSDLPQCATKCPPTAYIFEIFLCLCDFTIVLYCIN